MTPEIAHLLDTGTTQERSGLWADAARTYAEAFRLAREARDPAAIMEVVVRQGHRARLAGERETAEEMLTMALDLARLHGSDSTAGRALNGLGLLAQVGGNLAEAERLYRQANELGRRAGDPVITGETEQNLGILANIRGDYPEALARYLSGLQQVEQAGSERGRITVLNNLGMLRIDMGDLDAADGYFLRAMEIAQQVGDVVREGVIHVNRAELFLARGELDRARDCCDQGFEIFSRLHDEYRRAEALKFYGVIYRESGKLSLAAIHLQQAVEIAARAEPLLEAEAQRELALVLRAQGRNREALAALNRSHALFTTLQARSDQADIDQRIEQLEEDFLSLVRFWGESIEAKDRYTSGHCARVADYACRLAERIGLPAHDLVWFRMGAFLHDLGKTEVPEEILNKPGRLTDEERAVMERHTVIGDEMLKPVEFPWDIRPMVRSHHERWDGTGYPDRLAGDAIPLAARVLRIADVFDALTTARSYRRPLSPDEAFGIMERDGGSFDPELFEVFRELFPELVATAEEAGVQASVESSSPATG